MQSKFTNKLRSFRKKQSRGSGSRGGSRQGKRITTSRENREAAKRRERLHKQKTFDMLKAEVVKELFELIDVHGNGYFSPVEFELGMVDVMVSEVMGFSGIIPPDGSVREAFGKISHQLFKHREVVTLVDLACF